MLAAPSLGKRPTEVQNSKPFRFFLPPLHEHPKGFLSKCTALTVDLLQGHQIYSLEVYMCALFSPEILQAGAVKGLKHLKEMFVPLLLGNVVVYCDFSIH